MKTIPYGRQDVTERDIEAVSDVLRSDWLTQGPAVPRFEEAVAKYCEADFGVAVSSATSALHVACLALDLGPGDWLWTSSNTFVASANCGLYCGAKVDFIDIDPHTYNMCVDDLEAKLEAAEREGRLPKVVIPVHFAGQSCDMKAIYALSRKYDFRIIEDASHAIGGRYRGEPIGNCRFSDIAIFSFHPVKIITTGEGGMAMTNDSELANRMRRLRTHGITREPAMMSRPPDGPWYYEQIELGLNYRMTDIQAALGLSQLDRLDRYIDRRKELVGQYESLLAGLPVAIPLQHPDSDSAWHLYVVRLDLSSTERTHLDVFTRLRRSGVGVNLHYIPVHTQPYYQAQDLVTYHCPEAERYYAEALSLPLFPTLRNEDQESVVTALADATGVLQ